ncbi:cell surface glycoprotein CD200 receptor 1-A-like isoform X2 [Acanthopagrus latus]|uniref:cell surface glycoprotein CD200 receptor 1-A-like isoform X2 n=1 Tax=Acanthopagrus latus TaxID=8177 RepID=UPI00187C24D7|nr:cell surface glycoprotein CD200 receptor 1-A-like isoform X2 [Acanthopagrus latus]
MRDMMWIYAAFILLLSEAWSLGPVVRHSAFNEGSDVDLTCSNKTWNETLYVIWTIQLKYRNECQISLDDRGRGVDTCKDGKSLTYTSSTQSYLHIPDFTNGDEGVYKCESVYKGGSERYEINVAITVPPRTSAWFDQQDNKMVAVCKAEKGKPAANILWSHAGNISDVKTLSEPDGFFTVESRLKISEGMDTENLSCAISHPYWREEKILELKLTKGPVTWLCISAAAGLVFLAAVVFFAQKKLVILRQCQQSDSSPSKTAPVVDVEEVEPYASYVQRVNSIYNSSADLFT